MAPLAIAQLGTAILGSVGVAGPVSAGAAAVTGATAVAATTAAVGSTISNQKRRTASIERAAKEQAAANKKATEAQISALEEQQQLDTSKDEANRVRQDARELQRRKVATARGRRSTILTTPLGVPGQGDRGTKKTLIGA